MKVSIEKIIEEMPEDLTELEKTRYIYLELGKVLAYNTVYKYYPESRFTRDMYDENITIDSIEKNDYSNKIDVLCKQATEILQETLSRIGIKSQAKGYEEGEYNHIYLLTNIKGRKYYLDIVRDLANIQKGFKTQYFGTKPYLFDRVNCNTLNQEKVQDIDFKLGYCKKGMYMNDVIDMIKKEMKDRNNFKNYILSENLKLKGKRISKDIILKYKVDFIYNYFKNNIDEENKMGITEVQAFYGNIFKKILTNEDRNKISHYQFCYDENGTTNFSSLIQLDLANTSIYYFYDDEQRGFVEISEDDLIKAKNKMDFLDIRPEIFQENYIDR